MTHNEWEQGKRLTIHNATKQQLQFMVKDRDARISSLYKENEELSDLNKKLATMLGTVMGIVGDDEKVKEALKNL